MYLEMLRAGLEGGLLAIQLIFLRGHSHLLFENSAEMGQVIVTAHIAGLFYGIVLQQQVLGLADAVVDDVFVGCDTADLIENFVELRTVDGELPSHLICADLCHVIRVDVAGQLIKKAVVFKIVILYMVIFPVGAIDQQQKLAELGFLIKFAAIYGRGILGMVMLNGV